MAFVTTSLKVNVDETKMRNNQLTRLRQVLGRDTRILTKYLDVIAEIIHNSQIQLLEVTKSKKFKFDTSILDQHTLTTKDRTKVQHDLKQLFPRISHNEMLECRDTSIGMYKSYLELRKENKDAQPPRVQRQIPRSMGYRRFSVKYKTKTLKIMDSMDTQVRMKRNGNSKTRHNWITIPLRLSTYHMRIMKENKVVAVKIIRTKNGYSCYFALKETVKTKAYDPSSQSSNVAVVGIDLGMNKDAVISVLTKRGISHEYFVDTERIHNTKLGLKNLNKRLSSLQREAANRKNDTRNSTTSSTISSTNRSPNSSGKSTDSIMKSLRDLADKRAEYKRELCHQITAEMVLFIQYLETQYDDIYVSMGDLTNINKNGRRQKSGNKKQTTRRFRRRLGRWAYRMITDMLTYKLNKLGMQKRFVLLEEFYTSKKCWKCGTIGQRPKQAQFICNNSTCNWQGNADFNGATNIAKRAVLYFKLTELVNAKFAKENVSGQGAIVPVTNSRTGGNMSITSYLDDSPNEKMITRKMRQTVPEDSSINSQEIDEIETGQTEARVSLSIDTELLSNSLFEQSISEHGRRRLVKSVERIDSVT